MIPSRCPQCGERVIVRRGEYNRTIYCDGCNAVLSEPEADERPRGRRPKPKKRGLSTPKILLLVSGGLFLACGGMCTLSYALFIHEIDEPVTAADKTHVITAEHVAQFVPGTKVDPARAKFSKVRHLDGSRDLTYEYEDTADPEKTVYVTCTVSVERSAKDARDAYAGLKIGNKIGIAAAEGVIEVERKDLWTWGDDSRCVLLQSKGNSVGNSFMACKGKRYFIIYIVGIYFDKRGSIQDLLRDFLNKVDSYEG
ncbi:MAG: hypothetical protein EXS09_15000 [Gemmataceae bacterium]|nr:hypothetical protein [Gemmataceae bacterium]